jgi:hypothetical protein
MVAGSECPVAKISIDVGLRELAEIHPAFADMIFHTLLSFREYLGSTIRILQKFGFSECSLRRKRLDCFPRMA